ncbi:MAG TPA: hypothetical protein DIS76_01240, partial [Rhodospirillaceae bacterium]|nr:hypothetical protein [Rhodospirillaceae bacterium]
MQILRAFLPSGLLSHVGAFYVHRVLTLCFPLLLLPLIATRLTVNAMGIFFVLQAWGLTLSYIIDYGFSTRGARSMASTDNADGRSTEISRIITAQLLLCGIILPTWILCRSFIPILQDNAMGAVLAFIMGAATAITPNWYFLGTHRLSGFIITDILSRIVTLIGIFILPYADGDFNTPYVIISVGQFITCGIALCLMARREDLKIVRLGAGLSALRENWKLCLNVIGFALSVSLNT